MHYHTNTPTKHLVDIERFNPPRFLDEQCNWEIVHLKHDPEGYIHVFRYVGINSYVALGMLVFPLGIQAIKPKTRTKTWKNIKPVVLSADGGPVEYEKNADWRQYLEDYYDCNYPYHRNI
jgi:hypothetical protein